MITITENNKLMSVDMNRLSGEATTPIQHRHPQLQSTLFFPFSVERYWLENANEFNTTLLPQSAYDEVGYLRSGTGVQNPAVNTEVPMATIMLSGKEYKDPYFVTASLRGIITGHSYWNQGIPPPDTRVRFSIKSYRKLIGEVITESVIETEVPITSWEIPFSNTREFIGIFHYKNLPITYSDVTEFHAFTVFSKMILALPAFTLWPMNYILSSFQLDLMNR